MISSNTRATRSRYSSPGQGKAEQAEQGEAAAPATAAAEAGGGGDGGGGGGGPPEAKKSSGYEPSRAFMRKWLEPTVQQKATFEQAGMLRYGVLENMQPRGRRQ